jgi:hypothetical protein
VGPDARRFGIEALAIQEQVLDQLQVGIEGQRLVIDRARPDPRADRETRDPEPVAVHVDLRRDDVIAESAPVIR